MEASETNSRSTDQPNNELVWESLSAQEKLAAEESLAQYCRPVELYNIIKDRAEKYSLYLRRCMDYKIKAERKKRLVLTVTLTWEEDDYQTLFPLCVCLGRQEDPNKGERMEQKYHVGRIYSFQGLSGIDGKGNARLEVNFMLPEFDKLDVEVNSSEYCLLIFASAENPISLSRASAIPWPVEVASNASSGGERCLYGKVSLAFKYVNGDVYLDFVLEPPGDINIGINLLPCILTYYLQYCIQRKTKIISIEDCMDSEFQMDELKQIGVSLCLQEFGAMEKSSCQTDASTSASPSSSHFLGWKEGNVVFYYRYYNNMLHRTEVTENFSCPICLARCSTFKGLQLHLRSSHDYLDFEFSKLEDSPSVYVNVKTIIRDMKDVAQGIDPREQTFLYCAKPLRHREPKNVSRDGTNDTDQLDLHDGNPTEGSETIILNPGRDCVPTISDPDNGTPPTVLVDHEKVSDIILLPGPDRVPSISNPDDGTHKMLQDDHEEVSKAIIVHPGPYCVPSMPDYDTETHEMVQDDPEEVSNAILQLGPNSVPAISDHEDGKHVMLQDDHEGVSNEILDPSPDYVPSITDHHDGAPEVPHIDHEGPSNAVLLYSSLASGPSTSRHQHGTPEVPQAMKEDELPSGKHDPKIVAALEKRQFYHSHKYQPMSLEEALVDEDSEDEMNEGAQEIEEKRKISRLNLPDHLKEFLPMWNNFVKKHRVVADGHINWACEAFTKYHAPDFARNPALAWDWRLFMIKLHGYGLLKIPTFVECNRMLAQYGKPNN